MDKSLDNKGYENGNTYELSDFDSEQSQKHVSEIYETLDAFNSDLATASTGHSADTRCETVDDHDARLIPTNKSNRKKLVYTAAKIAFVAILLVALSVVVVVYLSSRKEDKNKCADYSLLNGKIVNATGSREGDTLQVECNSASKLVGAAVVTCYATGQWSDYPRCIPKECDDFVAPSNGKVVFSSTSTNIGATVLVTCKQGFIRKGTEAVVCQSNETWSDSPSCEPVDCGMPKNIENGEIRDMTGTIYNNTFRVVCSLGYQLAGVSTVICELNGLWEETPVCKTIVCGIPSIPKNGHIKHLEGYTFGSAITLQCDEGFFINGNPTINCTADGNWTGLPTCDRNPNAEVVDCGTPSVENGDVSNLTNTKYNDAFSVRCLEGYSLKGNETVICGNDGTWSDMPECIPVSCGSPAIPNNGYVDMKNGTTYNSLALITCDEGYSVNGSKEIRCKDNGEWTPVPTCELQDCGLPPNVENGEIKGLSGTKYNDSYSLECNNNYTLIGFGTVVCDTNGSWTNVPDCVAQTNCGVLPRIKNGSIIGVIDMNTFYVKCNNGYHLTGENTLICNSYGRWSTPPNCQLIDCGTPNISHAILVGLLNTSYGSLVSVSCNTGYSLIGTGTIQCSHDGQWENIPSCELVTCGLPEVPANGTVDNLQGTRINDTVSFRCNPWFRLNGTHSITCESNGKWTEGPNCIPDCGTLPNIENGRIAGQNRTNYTNTFSVQCNDGYVIADDKIVKCDLSGKWTDLPSCTPVSCGIPAIPRNGMILTITGTHFNAVATVKCDEGYALVGNSVISCLGNGSWTFTPRCQPKDCGLPQNIHNGGIKELTGTKYNSTFYVECVEGYVLAGSTTVACKTTGSWSKYPACISLTESLLKDCGFPPNVTNGEIRGLTGTDNMDTFSVQCNEGFVLLGNMNVSCDLHGNWTTMPSCNPVSCGIPELPENRRLTSLRGTTFQSTARMECDEGFAKEENTVITCLSNGSWTWISPCDPIDCGTPNISNGIIEGYTNAGYGSTFYVTCEEAYSLFGSPTVTCGRDGRWNLPSCKIIPCGLPEIPENGAIDSMMGTMFNRTVSISCNTGFILNGTNFVTCVGQGQWTKSPTCRPASDCYDVYLNSNISLSGIYNVTLWKSKRKILVYCDMETDGGGWTVFQYRFNGSVDFYNTMSQYAYGFGNLTGEFWLGLTYINEIASQSKTTLRIDLSTANGTSAYETFQNFFLSGRYSYQYALYMDPGKGTAGDGSNGFSYNRNRYFSTRDRDYDVLRRENCAVTCHGGWWYNACSYVNLNGEYLTPGTKVRNDSRTTGMVYLPFIDESLKLSKMMIRRG